MDAPAIRMPWYARAIEHVRRALAPVPGGAGGAGELPASPGYPVESSMSAYARFPWVRVCVRAKAGDISGLPLVAIRREGGKDVVLPSHPALDLLARPTDRMSGLRLRRQLAADYLLTGNWFLLHRAGTLARLHPRKVTPIADPQIGQVSAYVFDGRERLPWQEVLHAADISWADDVTQALGEGAIRALHDDLSAELSAKEVAAKQARRGRFDLLLTPKDHHSAGGQELIDRITEKYERAARAGHGVFVVGHAFEPHPLSFSAREMEYAAMRRDTRDATLAVFGVPPTRAGIPAANYGTAKTEMRLYWESLISELGRLFEDEFSRLTGDPSIRIEHDATGVEALQVSYTERQIRASTWVHSFGAEPHDAAAYEGFPDAPTGAVGVPAERPGARKPEEPQGDRRALADVLHGYLQGAAHRYQARLLAVDGEPALVSLRESEAVRVLVELERAGVPEAYASTWAGEIASLTDEAVRQIAESSAEQGTIRVGIESLSAFGPDRARRLASQISANREAAA